MRDDGLLLEPGVRMLNEEEADPWSVRPVAGWNVAVNDGPGEDPDAMFRLYPDLATERWTGPASLRDTLAYCDYAWPFAPDIAEAMRALPRASHRAPLRAYGAGGDE